MAKLQSPIRESLDGLDSERRAISREVSRANEEIWTLIDAPLSPETADRLADLQERIRLGERRLTEIGEETYRLKGDLVSEEEVTRTLRDFDPV